MFKPTTPIPMDKKVTSHVGMAQPNPAMPGNSKATKMKMSPMQGKKDCATCGKY